jgi:DNA-binding NtrC family response regulator/tetratricopeptide (TPR) repeat protein
MTPPKMSAKAVEISKRSQSEGGGPLRSAAPSSWNEELERAHQLLDGGQSRLAEERLRRLIQASGDESLQAQARCLLSLALEMQGRYREALEVVRIYEVPSKRAALTPETNIAVRVRIGLAYNQLGDHPKAIALLQATLREIGEDGSAYQLGLTYSALARVYRSINENSISHDYAERALAHLRRTGDWRGLAETYLGIAVTDTLEGNYEMALENFQHALDLIGDRPALFTLGKIYANMAGAYWFLKRPQDGIRCLEKAIGYYERTEHKANAALGYNNLGINLILLGDWKRAQEALERALELALSTDRHTAQVPMILDSLGELATLRGDHRQAQDYLERAVRLATEHGNKWYIGQARRTLGRLYLAMGQARRAIEEGRIALALAESISDRQAIRDAHLLLAEAHLDCGHLDECNNYLQTVSETTSNSAAELANIGEAQRIYGILALAQADHALAAHHFGRSVSIFEMLGDRYRSALAHYWLGRTYANSHPERAIEHLSLAAKTFRELGARPLIERSEEALRALGQPISESKPEPSALAQILTLRLTEAVASRELLLRELAAIIHQEANSRFVVLLEQDRDDKERYHLGAAQSNRKDLPNLVVAEWNSLGREARERWMQEHDVSLFTLRPTHAPQVLLLVSPAITDALPNGLALYPLLRVVELGLDVCALRERTQTGFSSNLAASPTDQSLMPGFIHSSPAMMRLIEEVHKIRSSDVTVLITGESGTGKELVARAIHQLSSRRTKVFIPFNCTAVPKELAEAYLFGYRRGAFTGAIADSPGVIRTAAGGTLFLDEVGDLPLDVQPKLLRFLQEGEIQPLGDQRPTKIDVRIIAATNTDLERLVAEGRFREDLYYRLNVIRLCVPPLRERRSEIPAIVTYYLNHYSSRFGRRDIQITPQAMDLLMVYDWPGNVRQLCNEIQRIVARAEDGTIITPDHLSPEVRRKAIPLQTANPTISAPTPGMTLADALTTLEKRMIVDALRRHRGNISRTARELGLTRRGLYLKMERYGLDVERIAAHDA